MSFRRPLIACAVMAICSCVPLPRVAAQQMTESDLRPVFRAPAEAFGLATLQRDDGSESFDVAVRGLPVGIYELRIDGRSRGTFSVNGLVTETSGAIGFVEPVMQTGQRRLTIDPAATLVEVFPGDDQLRALFGDNDLPVLSGTVAPGVAPGPGPDRIDGFRRQRAQSLMVPRRNAITGMRAMAQLQSGPNRATLVFNVRGLPPHEYELRANGLFITDFQPDNNGNGRVVLTTSPTQSQQRLTFDPTQTEFALVIPGDDDTDERVMLAGRLRGSDLLGGFRRVGAAPMPLEPLFDAGDAASGSALLIVNPDEFLLDLEIRDVPPGTYTLLADSEIVARFNVVEVDSDEDPNPPAVQPLDADGDPVTPTVGAIRLTTTPVANERALIFDALGARLEILGPIGRPIFQVRLPGSMEAQDTEQ